MGALTRAKRRSLEGRAPLADRISSLPDDVLRDIISLLPTKDGARTQVLCSRWRHLWRSAPLNLSPVGSGIPVSEIPRILSAHQGPGHRFSMPECYLSFDDGYSDTTLDGWLRSPALDGLQVLKIHQYPRLLLPASVQRFSSTLRVATFGGCSFPDGNNPSASALFLPALRRLTLSDVCISGSSLHALLAGCPVLQSLLLLDIYGSPRLQIMSPSLRSIDVSSGWRSLRLRHLVIEDAPCLQRLQCSGRMQMDILVISAPRLGILGELSDDTPRVQFGTTVFQGSIVDGMAAVVRSVKVLCLSDVKLCLDVVINLMKCFPNLEELSIKATSDSVENAWYQTKPELIGALNIGVRKIVLENYQGSKSHTDFVKFFLSNARVLELLELGVENVTSVWIARQHKLLHLKENASRGVRVTFVPLKVTVDDWLI